MFGLLARRGAYPFRSERLSEIMMLFPARKDPPGRRDSALVRTKMRQRAQLGFSLLAILAAGMTLSAVWPPAMASTDGDQEEGRRSERPLTAQEIRNLIDRVIENQHSNDVMLAEYARTEHEVVRGNGKEPEKDTVRRLIPAGEAVLHVDLEHNGKVADAPYLDQQWHTVAQALVASAHGEGGGNFFERERHPHERVDMVTSIAKAFIFRWAGRASIDGRTVVKLNFEPDPTYRSSARFAPLYAHSRGVAWVDESSGQLIKAEAELTDDVYWGGGLIAKLYHGGRFTYEQREVVPGVWMPTYYAYDFDGRKFLFSLSAHARAEFTDYLRVGPPEEALIVVRREHPGIFANKN